MARAIRLRTNRIILRLEGAAIAALGIAAYGAQAHGWWLFAALILLPDVAMLGYLRGPWAGAQCYNLGHSYLAPLALGVLAHVTATDAAMALSLIWIVHIGADRAMGYGLKYATGFADTHLGRV